MLCSPKRSGMVFCLAFDFIETIERGFHLRFIVLFDIETTAFFWPIFRESSQYHISFNSFHG